VARTRRHFFSFIHPINLCQGTYPVTAPLSSHLCQVDNHPSEYGGTPLLPPSRPVFWNHGVRVSVRSCLTFCDFGNGYKCNNLRVCNTGRSSAAPPKIKCALVCGASLDIGGGCRACARLGRARRPSPHGAWGEFPDASLLGEKGAGILRLRRGFTS
jgi:hypothetical protein